MKKLVALVTACSLCSAMLLCGCQSVVTAGSAASSAAASNEPAASAAEEETPAEPSTLSIACTSGGFNPYVTGDMVTLQNAALLYEPFVCITPDLDLDYRIAQSIDNSGVLVTVQIRSGCFYADGSQVTAEDAAASLNAARVSSLYAGRFANISDIVVEGSAVCITLNEPDSLFAYLLDIPVLRADEVGLAKPACSGRYTFGGEGELIKNARAAFPDEGPDVINYSTVSSADQLVSGLAVGTVDLYVLSNDSAETTSINAVESYYRSNDLVYIGVNSGAKNPLCATAEGRRLLSALAARNDLASKGYYSRAYAATGAINNYYPCVKGRQTILASADDSSLNETMAALGYMKDIESGLYKDEDEVPASVNLLIYSGSSYKRYTAQLLKEEWEAAGIQVNITEAASFDNYLAAIQSRQFELYIGEVKLYNNIDLSPFWSGQASYGISRSETLSAAYTAFRQNAGTAGDFETAFAAEMPFIPLLWHSGTVVTSRHVGGINASLSSAYYSLSDLTID